VAPDVGLRRPRRSAGNPVRVLGRVAVLCLLSCQPCFANDLVYICKSIEARVPEAVYMAAEYYGLRLRPATVGDSHGGRGVAQALAGGDVSAVIVSADALTALDRSQVFRAVRQDGRRKLPILIADVHSATDPAALRIWTGKFVLYSGGPFDFGGMQLEFTKELSEIAGELAGQRMPVDGRGSCLSLGDGQEGQTLLDVRGKTGRCPILIRSVVDQQEVFVATHVAAIHSPNASWDALAMFLNYASTMMYARYSAGDAAWHKPSLYANLTIDDPWLTEPYGNLRYAELLKHMQSANFHSTIAFIPWNFDRSQPEVVSLFRNHPERFSVCIHGNNHDHREFYDYDTKSLAAQISDVKQALARMERFKSLTGIRYDAVEVWPHEVIPPAATLAAFKANGYWANVNEVPAPEAEPEPVEPMYALRSENLRYGNFLTVRRSQGDATHLEARVALDAFLGNPILLYVHQNFFAEGMGAFDATAHFVNTVEPEVRWASLGTVMQHSYLLRRSAERRYDVAAFSSNFMLENPSPASITYLVKKEESFVPPVTSVAIDGATCPFQRAGNELAFQLTIPSGEARHVVIRYQSETNPAPVDISGGSLRIRVLRRLSDFRDEQLSTSAAGRGFIRFYNAHLRETSSIVERNAGEVALALLLTVTGIGLGVRRRRMTSQLQATGKPRRS